MTKPQKPPRIVTFKLVANDIGDPKEYIDRLSEKFPKADEIHIDLKESPDEVLETKTRLEIQEGLNKTIDQVQELTASRTDDVPPLTAPQAVEAIRSHSKWWNLVKLLSWLFQHSYRASASVIQVAANIVQTGLMGPPP